MTKPVLQPSEVAKIGFNDSIVVDERTFHVQTEVRAKDGVIIRTTIIESGQVKFTTTRPCPDGLSSLAAVSAAVETQHKFYLRELQRMGTPWLAST